MLNKVDISDIRVNLLKFGGEVIAGFGKVMWEFCVPE